MLRLVCLAIVVSAVTCDPLRFLPFGWGGSEEPAQEELTGSAECPDKQGTCPDGSTCCLLSTGKYGCCPYPNAVCCSDHLHCCPSGFTCDTAQQMCNAVSGDQSFDWMLKIGPVEELKEETDVVCPGNKLTCPTGNTCCKENSGDYGCCPMDNAECCSDGRHCCPSGYKCDVAQATCTKSQADIHVTWVSMSSAREYSKGSKDDSPCYSFKDLKSQKTKCKSNSDLTVKAQGVKSNQKVAKSVTRTAEASQFSKNKSPEKRQIGKETQVKSKLPQSAPSKGKTSKVSKIVSSKTANVLSKSKSIPSSKSKIPTKSKKLSKDSTPLGKAQRIQPKKKKVPTATLR